MGIRVLLVDASPTVIDGLRSILQGCPEIEVVGEETNGADAVDKAIELRPDVVLVDAQVPGMGGVETSRRIKDVLPGVKVLFMAVHPDLVEAAIGAGVDCCLVKDCSRYEFIGAVRGLGNARPDSVSP